LGESLDYQANTNTTSRQVLLSTLATAVMLLMATAGIVVVPGYPKYASFRLTAVWQE
jgi:hypothetical protein